VNKLGGIIQGPDDLFGKTVATVSDSTAEKYLIDHIGKKKVRRFPDIQEAYQVLQDGKVDAIVYDAPVLQYYASHQEKGLVKVVGAVFNREYYAIALPNGSPLKENINMILLEFMEERKYQELRQEWFGSK
jgi:polar amino acid transport system substrate-binding protein